MSFVPRLALALALVLALGAGAGPASARTIGQIIDDTAIATEIKARLTAETLSNLTNINVKSEAGVVTLSGSVDSPERRARAVQIAGSVGGVKTVLNNIDVKGASADAAASPALEVTGTVASVDRATGTITLQDGRMLRTTEQTAVWQASSVGALSPGAQVIVRGAAPAGVRMGKGADTRHWRMATISRVDRTASELILSDGTTVRLTPATNVHRGGERVTLERLEPGSEVVVYTSSPRASEANEVAVLWSPTASAR